MRAQEGEAGECNRAGVGEGGDLYAAGGEVDLATEGKRVRRQGCGGVDDNADAIAADRDVLGGVCYVEVVVGEDDILTV